MAVHQVFQRYFRKRTRRKKTGSWLKKLTISLLISAIWVLLGGVQTVFAESLEQPQTCQIGVYVLSLYDFNITEGSFGTDFWVWTNCSAKNSADWNKIDFVNAKELNATLESTEEKKGVYWSLQKIQGTFKHRWDVANFPFDRHVLKIPIENSFWDATKLVYRADEKNSSYDNSIQIHGWRMTDLHLREQIQEYVSNFGDPELAPGTKSQYSRAVIEISLKRSSLISFLKMTTAVYISLGIALAVYFIHPSKKFEPRIGTLVGTLFAIVVNQQVTDSILGETDSLKLVDQIHITAMAYVLAAVIVSILSFLDCEKDKEKTALRRDRLSFRISCISLIVLNLILVGHAAIAG